MSGIFTAGGQTGLSDLAPRTEAQEVEREERANYYRMMEGSQGGTPNEKKIALIEFIEFSSIPNKNGKPLFVLICEKTETKSSKRLTKCEAKKLRSFCGYSDSIDDKFKKIAEYKLVEWGTINPLPI